MQYAPTRVRTKFGGFHISAHGYAKNAPDFTFPNKDTPKTHPILGANLRRRIFEGRMQYAPTRVHAKIVRFHISAHGYVQNLTGFTFPNRDTPKTHPVLYPNLRRGYLRGVCNTPLHGYVQNLLGFIFPHAYPPKTHPVSPFPIGIHRKPARFYTQTVGEGHFGAYAIRPYTDTPKIPPGFRPKPSAMLFQGRMLLRPYMGTCKTRPVSYFRIRIRQKRTRFHLSQ